MIIGSMVGNLAFKAPAIAKKMRDREIALLSTYFLPKTNDDFFSSCQYEYDEYFDCFLCQANEILHYNTTNRDGYREYKGNPTICKHCP